MLMIDEIYEVRKDRGIRGGKKLSLSEEFFLDHFPTNPILPGSLIIESMFQLASCHISIITSFQYMGMLRSIKKAKFKKIVRPGDQLDVSLQMVPYNENDDHCRAFDGTACVNQNSVAVASFDIVMIPFAGAQAEELVKRIYPNAGGYSPIVPRCDKIYT
jgi:3-hydroxymyristoyl/3-hydroxydecanoyl-(acyl carrier protein) dehydratase